jgi:hypothetical protein
MHEVRVTSWTELHERLYEDSWREDLHRHRSHWAYRGWPTAGMPLETTLTQLGEGYAELETHILRNFRKYAGSHAALGDSIWNWLALAQHHGLPTRLLDWTYSPQVALHFATQDLSRSQDDAVICCIDYVRAHQVLPRVLHDSLRTEAADVFTAEMIHAVAPTLADFEGLSRAPFVLFFEPPALDARITNQFALFSTMSQPAASLVDWLAEHPGLYRQIVVPRELKWEVRDKLDQANVTERVLFPGLDGLCRWLKRQYTRRSD